MQDILNVSAAEAGVNADTGYGSPLEVDSVEQDKEKKQWKLLVISTVDNKGWCFSWCAAWLLSRKHEMHQSPRAQ